MLTQTQTRELGIAVANVRAGVPDAVPNLLLTLDRLGLLRWAEGGYEANVIAANTLAAYKAHAAA